MEIKKKVLYATFLGSALLFQQCGSDEPAAKKKETEVYVGGELNIGAANWAAAFTKNGVMDTLESGSVESGVYAITGLNDNIYMAGFVNNQAAYWKNGEVNLMDLGASNWAIATNIFLKGQDIHMAGRASTANGDQVVYWKNGVATLLGNGYTSGNGSGLVVSDANDVYVTGYGNDGAGYWKNGNWNLVSDPLLTSQGQGIAVDGSDIYVVGYYLNDNNGWTACYWKNGNMVELGGPSSFAYDIKIVNGDVYVAGHERKLGADNLYRDVAMYWKNGEEVQLTDMNGGTASYGYNIQVKGNDVYVSGEVEFACNYKSVVWKNGELVAPFNGDQACYFGDFYTMYVR